MTFNVQTNGAGTGTVSYSTAPSGANQATEGAGPSCDTGDDYLDASGTLTFNQSGGGNEPKTISVTICGDTSFEANESFTVTLSNATPGGGNGMNLATPSASTGTITNDDVQNDPPSGANKTITINEDATHTFAAADSGYTDPNAGDAMSAVRIDTLPAAGALKLSGSTFTAPRLILTADIPNLTFEPAANASGSPYASFTFSVRDTNGPAFDPTPNTITFNLTPVDDPPVAVNDSASVGEDSGATAISVLLNDTDIDGGPKTIASKTNSANGTVTITGGGTGLTYQPNANYCNDGSPLDAFTYTLNGGSTATVSLTVTCVNDPPSCIDRTLTTNENAVGSVAPSCTDVDTPVGSLTYAIVAQPSKGTASVVSGNLRFDPNGLYEGLDTGESNTTDGDFTYKANDGTVDSNTANVDVTVTGVNDAPVCLTARSRSPRTARPATPIRAAPTSTTSR